MIKLSLALLAGLLAAAGPPPEPAPNPPAEPMAAPEGGVAIGIGADKAQRMTVPVSIGGRGPFRFVVDTGAERTVIARELARDLDLDGSGSVRVHSMSEVSNIATVLIPTLDMGGGRKVRGIKAPALERVDLGAEGMLGVDALQKQRVSFDFARQEMTIVPSKKREEGWVDDAIVVTARSRFGHLVLIDASVDGVKVWVIVDTGSQTTVGNTPLRRMLERRHRMGTPYPVVMVSVTGGRIMADQAMASVIRLGDADIHNMPIAFADVHPFRQLGLADRPALLLGMDALRLFDRVSVDFANRRVRLLTAPRSSMPSETRMARVERKAKSAL
jgi:predicted aspartyl protease